MGILRSFHSGVSGRKHNSVQFRSRAGTSFNSRIRFLGLCILCHFGKLVGGVTCYYIGYLGKTEWIHTYLKIPEEKLSKMQRFLKGKGSLFGFFVFIPVIGDIMIVALGLLRANPLGTLLSMMVGKFSRYYLVVIGINYLKEWFPNLF